MKLDRAALRRYRSIEEMDPFGVEPDVTCLVGKNESGKTAVLQALYKSNPIAPDHFDEGLDYPSRLTRERRNGDHPIEVSDLTYTLEDEDIAALKADFGEGALSRLSVTVTTGYRYLSPAWAVDVDERAVVHHLRHGLELPPTEQSALDKTETVSALLDVLENLEDPNSKASDVVARVKSWPESTPSHAIIALLEKRRPKFVYFGEYDLMPGDVNIKDLIAMKSKGQLTRGQQAFLSLLHLASVEPEEFIDPESAEHLIRDIENASNGITDEVFTYWSQNRDLRVQLSLAQAAQPAQGPTIQIRILNERHHVTVPFDERSRGFVWFFSFLAYFSELEAVTEQPIILLLDEPGLSLHATAQADLLRFIDERLAPDHQVLFTTHSPFMVDPQKFGRVRTVQDHLEGGTQVSEDVLRADKDTAFPLMAAMGIELTQTLWVGPNVVLVEGPSDVIYLTFLSQRLESEGRQGLDPRWVLTPAGGITKLPSFLSLFGANKMNVVVVTDSSSGDTGTVRHLKEAGRLGSGGLVQVGDVLRPAEADIEDLFTAAFYVGLINDAYQGILAGTPLKATDLPLGDRLVKRVEAEFAARGLNNGHLNHFAPAGALLRNQLVFNAKVAESTLTNAEALFGKINKFLPD